MFVKHIRGYCNYENIEVEDWDSTENWVLITGDVTLTQIGHLYEYFKYEYDFKIEFIDYQDLKYCFKIDKQLEC